MSRTPSPAIELFSSRPTGEDTFVVLGAARGGTSMVAGLLRMLGIPMGEEIDPSNNEDRAFLAHRGQVDLFTDPRRARECKSYVAGVKETVERRNRDHSRWGWKDPAASFYLRKIAPSLRAPRFLFVTRDPGAVTGRRIEDRLDDGGNTAQRIADDLRSVLGQYDATTELLLRLRRPILLVSYERSLSHPNALIEAISRFTGLELPEDEADRAKLSAYVTPGRVTGDIDAAASEGPSQPDAAEPSRPDIEEQLAACNGEHALRRARMIEAAATLQTAQSSDPATLASALTEAMGADRQGEAEVLAFRLLCVLGATDDRLVLHPRALSAALCEPGARPAPATASLALFNLGMLAFGAKDPSRAYWWFAAARLVIEKAFGALDTPFLAPWWAVLLNQAVAARLCGDEVEARANCARILHAATLGLPIDLWALDREPEEYDRYRLLAERQLAEMSGTVS